MTTEPKSEDAGGPTDVVFHPHRFTAIQRPAGYIEFRCEPAYWTYTAKRPVAQYLTEFYSQLMGDDKHGFAITSEFWSGSDAALRQRELSKDDLAMRELVAVASRRSTGLNAPRPWISNDDVVPHAREWQPEADDVHFSQAPMDDDELPNLWSGYGMTASYAAPVITGYDMRKSLGPALGRTGSPWRGGVGVWYEWSDIATWDRWPRRQDATDAAREATSGNLLLFVSHRWETADYPDPNGAQLLCLKVGLTLALAAAVKALTDSEAPRKTQSGLPDLIAEFLEDRFETNTVAALKDWAERIEQLASVESKETPLFQQLDECSDDRSAPVLDDIRSRILVWYDYSSMHQVPRTASEEEEFRKEILTLNDIQSSAGTVVIAGNNEYLKRAWCFLELCGGMRHRITELTPSWGNSISVGDSVTSWASKSDQLIAALNTLGLESIQGSHLDATEPGDLAQIAALLSRLPLTGLIRSDDSDLVGGVLPTPYRNGEWFPNARIVDAETALELVLPTLDNYGDVSNLAPDAITRALDTDEIDGDVAAWVYTTNHALTLAWYARAGEICEMLRAELPGRIDDPDLSAALGSEIGANAACLWADSPALSDNGEGFTRAIPSNVRALVIITQVDIPSMCLIYDRVVQGHLANGCHVVCYSPETGRTLVYKPADASEIISNEGTALNVLSAPRLRRSDVAARRIFLSPSIPAEDVEVLPALRLDPADNVIGTGEQFVFDPAKGDIVSTGERLDAAWYVSHSRARTQVEGRSRSIVAMWNNWFPPLVHQARWSQGFAPEQMEILEALVAKARDEWDNPFERRRFLKILVQEHEGYLLPPSLVDEADIFIQQIREAQSKPDD